VVGGVNRTARKEEARGGRVERGAKDRLRPSRAAQEITQKEGKDRRKGEEKRNLQSGLSLSTQEKER